MTYKLRNFLTSTNVSFPRHCCKNVSSELPLNVSPCYRNKQGVSFVSTGYEHDVTSKTKMNIFVILVTVSTYRVATHTRHHPLYFHLWFLPPVTLPQEKYIIHHELPTTGNKIMKRSSLFLSNNKIHASKLQQSSTMHKAEQRTHVAVLSMACSTSALHVGPSTIQVTIHLQKKMLNLSSSCMYFDCGR